MDRLMVRAIGDEISSAIQIKPMKVRGFEKVSKYADIDLPKPIRKTEWSAGYDMASAVDVVIQPHGAILNVLLAEIQDAILSPELKKAMLANPTAAAAEYQKAMTLDLDTIKRIMKKHKLQPTLISTGYKAYMQPHEKLDLLVRSSAPLNSFIILANSVGLIDADYYNNADNEGEIFFQVINLSPVPLHIKKGDILGQGVFGYYLTTDDDYLQEKQPRSGGLGSTSL